MDLDSVVAADTQETAALCGSPFRFSAWWGLGLCLTWNVKCCRDTRLFFSALCSFIRKKKSIHIFSYMHLAALRLLAHRPSPTGEAQLGPRTDSSGCQGRRCKLLVLHLAVGLFKTRLLAGQGHQMAGCSDWSVTQVGGDALLRTPGDRGVPVATPGGS